MLDESIVGGKGSVLGFVHSGNSISRGFLGSIGCALGSIHGFLVEGSFVIGSLEASFGLSLCLVSEDLALLGGVYKLSMLGLFVTLLFLGNFDEVIVDTVHLLLLSEGMV